MTFSRTYATHHQKVAKLSAATWRISSISCRSFCSGWDLRVLPPGEYHVIHTPMLLNSTEFCIVWLFLCHFVHHLGICNPICVKLLQLMCAVITHNSAKKWSLYVNPLTAISRSSGYKLFVTRCRQPAFRIEHYMQNGAVNRCSG